MPVTMELVSCDLDRGELLVADLDRALVGVVIELGVELQAGAGGPVGDEVAYRVIVGDQ